MAAFCGFVVIFDYYFMHGSAVFDTVVDNVNDISASLITMSLFVGAAVLLVYFGRQVIKREKEWWLKAWTIVIILLTPILYAVGAQNIIDWMQMWVSAPVDVTISALGMLLYFSACFRTFRMRTLDSFMLMIGGVIIMLTFAPLWSGSILPWINPIGTWCIQVGYSAAQRALIIVGGIGAIIAAARVYSGQERGMLMEAVETETEGSG
jgi:hypothetical protein